MLWLNYDREAEFWDEALPVGNGRIGGMVFGKTGEEQIQVNEETLWNGKKRNRINPDAKKNLEQIRFLLRAGRIEEAERLSVLALSGTPQYQTCYQTLGSIFIRHHDAKREILKYRRGLCLNLGEVHSRFQTRKGSILETVFVSKPADCLAVFLQAEGEETLSFDVRLDRDRYYERAFAFDHETVAFEGTNNGNGFFGAVTVHTCDGEVRTVGEHLVVEGAKEAVFLFSAATRFESEAPESLVSKVFKRAKKKTAEELKKEHEEDFASLFERQDLFLSGDPEAENLTVSQRLKRVREGASDPGLIALYYQYGRYLLISSSRPGGYPATLQGIWNDQMTPAWDSKYTININLQMNYWMTDLCNLSECYEPFFAHLKRIRESGKETAEKMYGCRGFAAHHNTDLYADTAPQDQYIPATYWVMGGAWLCLHIWQHFEFTKDRDFLREMFPAMADAVAFFEDFLTEDEEGFLVTSPSVSPENTYLLEDGTEGRLCEGPAMDNQILTDLFSYYLKAAEELGLKPENSEQVSKMIRKIRKPKIGQYGQIMEWTKDYEEAEPGHRHISQLFAVFPSGQICYETTPDLMEAGKKTLLRRLSCGGGHTGWSRAWIILLWARFLDGEEAGANLRTLLSDSTFDNLMDNHPYANARGRVFQIDGNFGAACGIAEMLLQSQGNVLRILPALPKEWKSGRFAGIKIRGNGTADLFWEEGQLTELKVCMEEDAVYRIRYEEKEKEVLLKAGEVYRFNGVLGTIS